MLTFRKPDNTVLNRQQPRKTLKEAWTLKNTEENKQKGGKPKSRSTSSGHKRNGDGLPNYHHDYTRCVYCLQGVHDTTHQITRNNICTRHIATEGADKDLFDGQISGADGDQE